MHLWFKHWNSSGWHWFCPWQSSGSSSRPWSPQSLTPSQTQVWKNENNVNYRYQSIFSWYFIQRSHGGTFEGMIKYLIMQYLPFSFATTSIVRTSRNGVYQHYFATWNVNQHFRTFRNRWIEKCQTCLQIMEKPDKISLEISE